MNASIHKSLKPLISLLVALAAAMLSSTVNSAASDPRFFGTYCGTHRVDVEMPGKDESYDLEIRVYANHTEPRPTQGVVTGRGTATARNVGRKLRRHGLDEGRRIPFVFAGLVQRRGVLRGSARVVGIGPASASAILKEDGETITMEAFDFGEIELSKANCGNERPSAGIDNPDTDSAPPYPWGKLESISGWATDTEDAVSDLRMTWTSNRQPNWRQEGKGRTFAHIEELVTGTHIITFTVVDSGGRSVSVKREIAIENSRPDVPVIEVPAEDAHFTVGQCVYFRGRASDEQDGNLRDDSLIWTSSLVDRPLGIDTEFVCRPPTCVLPSGTQTITLTATDGAGAWRSASIPMTIDPRTTANSAPTVWVDQPGNWSIWGGGIPPSDPDDEDADLRYPEFTQTITMKAGYCDLEDETLADEQFTWTVSERVLADDGSVTWIKLIGRDDSGALFDSGEEFQQGRTATWVLDPARYLNASDIRYEIKVTATDEDEDSTTSKPVYIIVLPGVGLI